MTYSAAWNKATFDLGEIDPLPVLYVICWCQGSTGRSCSDPYDFFAEVAGLSGRLDQAVTRSCVR